jgi:hypothetical protein
LSGIFEALNSIPSAVKKKKPEKNQCNLFLWAFSEFILGFFVLFLMNVTALGTL